MSTTGITAFDHGPQVVAEWLNEICHDLDWGNQKPRAYMLLRATLHTVRDFLTVDEAVDLSAQLPVLVRGIYFEGWNPSKPVPRPRGKAEFLDRVSAHFTKEPLVEEEEAVMAVFALLRRKTSEGEIDHIAHSMHKSLRELWDRATAPKAAAG